MADAFQDTETDRAFTGLDLAGAELVGHDFRDCRFDDCSFAEATFKACAFRGCRFTGCDLRLVKLRDVTFASTTFTDCKLIGINWTTLIQPSVRIGCPIGFERCALNHSTFLGLDVQELQLVDCVARDVDFREANLTKATLTGSDLRDTHFLNTDLSGADFTGATDYALDPTQNTVTGARFSMPEAVALLECMAIELVQRP